MGGNHLACLWLPNMLGLGMGPTWVPWGLREPIALWPCQISGQCLPRPGQAAVLVLQETANAASRYATCMYLQPGLKSGAVPALQ